MPTGNPSSPDPAVIRLQNANRALIDAALSVQYALGNLPLENPLRCEWGRIAHALVSWSHDLRDHIEEVSG